MVKTQRGALDFERAYQQWKLGARKNEGDDLLVIDLGESKINCLYAKLSGSGKVAMLDYACSGTTGFSGGAVTDPAKFEAAVAGTIGEIRRRNRMRSRMLHVSLTAPFVSYFNHFASVALPPRRRVTRRLIEKAMAGTRAEISSLVEHVMQVVPVRYTLDSIYSGGEPPLGMRGSQLGIEFLFVTAPRAALEQIEKNLKACGYGVASWWYAGLSAADSVALPESEAGVAVVDVGSGSTDVAVFRSGRLVHIGVIDRGGRDFDSDLAVYLNTSIKRAEEVKCQYGCALPQIIRPTEVIDLKDRMLGLEKLIPARDVAAVIRDRAHDLFYAVEAEISRALSPEHLSRIILTGGMARLAGLAELAESVLGRSVEVGIPGAVNGTVMGISDPGCAVLVGTLRLIRRRILAQRRFETEGMTAIERTMAWLGWLVGSRMREGSELP